MPADLPLPPPGGYDDFLRDLKERIRTAQVRAALSVNRELVLLYWQIGRDILARQSERGWGAKVIDRLSQDLRDAFPEMQGFSPRNLKYMRAFAEAWPDESIVQQAAAQIPWFHNCVLLDKIKDSNQRQWYIHQTLQYGWWRNVLVHQIETNLFARQGQAVTNFDFLTLGQDAQERDLERGLLGRLRDFLLELGAGFAFVGSQYPLEVGGEDFYIDLLFYHLQLHCYIVIDLKMGKFTPADAGQMNFYLSAVDDLVRRPPDGPTLGVILCRTKNQTVAQYALRDLAKPLGVAEYRLPTDLQNALPSLESLERALTEAGKEMGTDEEAGP